MHKGQLIVNAIGEFAPIVVFLVASELFGFLKALPLLIATALISLVVEWRVSRRIPKFGLVASATIAFFGALSVLTQNEFFIIVKDTLYALTFATVLAVGLLFSRPYLKVLFGDFFAITERGWFTLTRRWTLFFLLFAFANEIARASLTPEAWAYYKLVAVVATWIFGFYQFTLARCERLPEANEWGLRIRDTQRAHSGMPKH